MLTPDQITQVKAIANPASVPSATMTPEQAKASFQSTATPTTPVSNPGQPMTMEHNPISDIGHTVMDSFKSGVDTASRGVADIQQGAKSKDVLGGIGQMVKGATNVVGGATGAFLSTLAPALKPVGDVLNKVGTDITNKKGGLVDNITSNPTFQKFAQTNPDETVQSVITILTSLMGGEKAPEVGKALDTAMTPKPESPLPFSPKEITTNFGETPAKVVPELNKSQILDTYNRAIRPTVTGKSTAGQVAKSSDSVISGLTAINREAPNLKFTDADGNVITGKTPESVDQLSQGIQQTKASIYKQYDALARKADGKGVQIDPAPISQELGAVVNSKSLQLTNPEAVKYAKDLQTRLATELPFDAQTTQEVIRNYNAELKAYYRNPTPGLASRIQIDAMIANKFRENLDNAISSATGKEYQALKNEYGALSSMEKDVTHRNIVWGRQNKVGLVENLANVASGAELVRGLLTMNPADMAVSGGIKAIQMYQKYLNNPDVGVQKMFNSIRASAPSPSSTGSMSESGVVNKESSPNPSTPKDTSQIPKGEGVTPELEPLAVEAKKYKSAKEFIESFKNNDIRKMKNPGKVKGESPIGTASKTTISRDTSLTGKDAQTQEASINKYESNPEGMVKEYLDRKGKVVNTDEARKQFADVGYTGTNARAVQEASSALSKDAYRSLLKTSEEPGALLYAGGSGTGKTSVVESLFPKDVNNAGAILDGNLSTMKSAEARITEAIKAGKEPQVIYVYRDPVDAWENGVIKRMNSNPNEGGRIVPLSVFLDNHIGSYNVVKNLLDKGFPLVKMIDNSLGKGSEALLNRSKFDSIQYASGLKDELLAKTKQLYESGKITKEQYSELIK